MKLKNPHPPRENLIYNRGEIKKQQEKKLHVARITGHTGGKIEILILPYTMQKLKCKWC